MNCKTCGKNLGLGPSMFPNPISKSKSKLTLPALLCRIIYTA
ncbi:hypothetical protein SAMN05421863_11146 [Nitrosomonas communis]|uniref:Uncharacterized protein n=1 Tax=Nitrosomonas communis TaxID=44574 RepID=A0A1I4WNK9_9PROT|nr:hypothetical protein SAMN05421863_11146 [Nitrosomonas communis]